MNKLALLIALIVSLQVTLGISLNAQSKSEKIAEVLELYKENNQFSGSALVAENGKVIHKGGNGWANMEWDIPNQADTKHRLGSITKQFTSMLVMQLVEEGRVDLETPIDKYIPDYESASARKINLHHLMTHTSGIPNYTSFPGFFQNDSRDPYTPKEFTSVFVDSTLNFEPGSDFEYSNSGYFLLGYIIETVTGNTYEEELEARIFKPLGMNDTGFDHHENILKNRATGYEKRGMGFANSAYLDMSIPYAAGSLYSTVEDLYKWDQALYSDKLISEASKDLMFTSHTSAFGGGYGYGWTMRNEDGTKVIGHGGGINGFNTLISRFPDSKNLVVLLNNTGGANLDKITMDILDILQGKTISMPKKSLARETYGILMEKGIDEAMSHFEAMKSTDDYEVDESDINAMGYDLLGSGKKEEALTIFKLNTDLFPDSWNVYDSYAETCAMMGDSENAVKYYTKSVELNPANQNGIDRLKKLGADVSELTKEVKVDAEILSTYLGKYELQPGFILTISNENGQLKAQASGQGTIDIFPKSDTEFYAKVVEAEVEFNKDPDGKVVSLTLKQAGQEMPAKKIE